jgi:putative transposase
VVEVKHKTGFSPTNYNNMSYIKIMVHCVWGTKNRQPILVTEKRLPLLAHIKKNDKKKDIFIDTIGGHTDHLHCLISLGADQNVAKVTQLIKGEASFWANKEKLMSHKLEWAEDYFAASVNESSINKVRNYINNQEEHHRKQHLLKNMIHLSGVIISHWAKAQQINKDSHPPTKVGRLINP